eukprot:TRINITY_DN1878_c0_g1_i3.p1 TRINITY_DN1878_c0_g1~~TRINITY_DN1878_c0_g1_i3.p1  ORF type:complete len:578 (-),score=52.60 TRINITY_DN1878_c0_g1_i3:155-1888(-)
MPTRPRETPVTFPTFGASPGCCLYSTSVPTVNCSTLLLAGSRTLCAGTPMIFPESSSSTPTRPRWWPLTVPTSPSCSPPGYTSTTVPIAKSAVVFSAGLRCAGVSPCLAPSASSTPTRPRECPTTCASSPSRSLPGLTICTFDPSGKVLLVSGGSLVSWSGGSPSSSPSSSCTATRPLACPVTVPRHPLSARSSRRTATRHPRPNDSPASVRTRRVSAGTPTVLPPLCSATPTRPRLAPVTEPVSPDSSLSSPMISTAVPTRKVCPAVLPTARSVSPGTPMTAPLRRVTPIRPLLRPVTRPVDPACSPLTTSTSAPVENFWSVLLPTNDSWLPGTPMVVPSLRHTPTRPLCRPVTVPVLPAMSWSSASTTTSCPTWKACAASLPIGRRFCGSTPIWPPFRSSTPILPRDLPETRPTSAAASPSAPTTCTSSPILNAWSADRPTARRQLMGTHHLAAAPAVVDLNADAVAVGAGDEPGLAVQVLVLVHEHDLCPLLEALLREGLHLPQMLRQHTDAVAIAQHHTDPAPRPPAAAAGLPDVLRAATNDLHLLPFAEELLSAVAHRPEAPRRQPDEVFLP